MNPRPRSAGDETERIVFDTENRDGTLQVFVGREIIEDHLVGGAMSFEKRLAFVERNRAIIEHNVLEFLASVEGADVTVIHVHHDLLKGCVPN